MFLWVAGGGLQDVPRLRVLFSRKEPMECWRETQREPLSSSTRFKILPCTIKLAGARAGPFAYDMSERPVN